MSKRQPKPPAKRAPVTTTLKQLARTNPSSPKDARLSLPKGTPMVWR
jgi:hypothetical protein